MTFSPGDIVYYDTIDATGIRVAGAALVLTDEVGGRYMVRPFGFDRWNLPVPTKDLRPVRMTFTGPVVWPECERIPVRSDEDVHTRAAKAMFKAARQLGKTNLVRSMVTP